jgi:hypothetical protein
MKSTLYYAAFCIITTVLFAQKTTAQCQAGETALNLSVITDEWAYEGYWQLTLGNECGVNVIAEGGNISQIGCNGAGEQDATQGNGYEAFQTYDEGPFCLEIGETYTLHSIDDWGDGGTDFVFNLFGFDMYAYEMEGGSVGTFEFTVIEPLLYDVIGESVLSYSYLTENDNIIKAKFFNGGAETITNVEMSYTIDGQPAVTGNISGLNIPAFSSFELEHPVAWDAAGNGIFEITVMVSQINGNSDLNTSNDVATKSVEVGPGIPNILDTYINTVPEYEQIAGANESIAHPRDLDFHPVLTRSELWVILKSTENEGGRTVKISNAGTAEQEELLQQDGNAWHFMSLPTGIAFSRNENFATSPGVYDANHDGGSPFTGPTLWSSDPAIYAQPSGGNGSHLDMLHESPYSMGIASEADNKFWLTCGDHNEIMSYDFREDHGPGNSDHSDGIIYKYPIPGYDEDPTQEIPDHLVMDHSSGWLYVCNSQQNRIIRINTASGTPGESLPANEAVAVYKYMDNFEWEVCVSEGLYQPTGIDIIEDRMLVSNYATGDINLYDISGAYPVLLGIIPTEGAGIMGIKVGPDGKIWYVNSITDQILRMSPGAVSVLEKAAPVVFSIYPNPSNDFFQVSYTNSLDISALQISVFDISGRMLLTVPMNNTHRMRIDASQLAAGVYMVEISGQGGVQMSERLMIER